MTAQSDKRPEGMQLRWNYFTSIFPLVNHLFVYLFLIPGTIETELYNNLTKLSLNHSGL